MLREPVSSSNINSVGYNSIQMVLEIEFHSGGVYQYFAVPGGVYHNLMNASSHGKYFHAHIRNQYRFSRVA